MSEKIDPIVHNAEYLRCNPHMAAVSEANGGKKKKSAAKKKPGAKKK